VAVADETSVFFGASAEEKMSKKVTKTASAHFFSSSAK